MQNVSLKYTNMYSSLGFTFIYDEAISLQCASGVTSHDWVHWVTIE